ncbi:hypothetical protein [Parapedobacter sp.]
MKMKNKNDLFSGPLLNILTGNCLPIAIYSAYDFMICYANEAFVRLWEIESLEGMSALKLTESSGNAAIMRALKSISSETARITLTHPLGNTTDPAFFESVFEKAATEPDFIVQTMHEITRFQTENGRLMATVSTLEEQNDELYKELLRTGQELEESYIALENAGTRMLEILESISMEVDLPGIGYWSLNLEDMSFELSRGARKIYGIPEDAPISSNDIDISRVLDKHAVAGLEQLAAGVVDNDKLYHFEHKINPVNGEPSKWLKTSGVVVGKNNDRVTKIAGVMIVM